MKNNFTDIEELGDDEPENEHEDAGEYEELERKTGAVIYLIDARKKMFLPSFEEDKLPIISCLESVRTAVRTKIFHSEKCLCSIILLGTDKAENPLTLRNLTVVQELSFLGADHVLNIDKLIKAVEDSTYKKMYGHKKFSLGDVFWLSSFIFSEKCRKYNQSAFLFTNDDRPTTNDSFDGTRAITNVQDLCKNSVAFELIPLGKDFNMKKFYKEIVLASKNDPNCVIPDPVTNVNEIVERITRKNFAHVHIVGLPFTISKGFEIGVSVHFLVQKAKLPFKTKLSKATNKKVVTKTEYFEEETGSVVKRDEIVKCQLVAQKEISFTLSELKAIQETGKKELKLLGFKPTSVLRLENFVRPCAFIYPNESHCKGSSVFFTALLKRCIAKQVVPICTLCPRTTSSCRFVALIPQEECPDKEKKQRLPPGFVVFFLPFAEEVRTIEEKPTERANPEQVEIAKRLIKKLKFQYKVSNFENPGIKKLWASIEALALDLQEPEQVNDSTLPNYDLISQRVGEIPKEFMEAVYEKDYDLESFTAPRKPKPNFAKPPSTVAEDVEEFVRQDRGEQLSNDALKNYLKSIGETKGISKLKKAELLEKVRTHLNLS